MNFHYNQKNILLYSPDLNLCASLLMYFYEKYSVTVTTKLENIEKILSNIECDILYLDTEPYEEVTDLLNSLAKKGIDIPTFITYVYHPSMNKTEIELKKFTKEIFYKPINLYELSARMDSIFNG